jgi:RNA-directed DNA polymerase
MTTPRYAATGCWAGSKVRRDAASAAWIVNLNNGNANNNHRNNHAFVRAVRSGVPSGECQGEVSLRFLYRAWKAARHCKRPSTDQARFDTFWADRLLQIQRQLQAGTWSPAPTTCFIATRPKAREIHAPAFADRVVHHWLIPQIEPIYEPRFIADSFANRRGKGSHAAVQRLQGFVRQVASGQGGGWFLQLDVHNFFNSIDRRILYGLLKRRMDQHQVPLPARRAVHALLRRSPVEQGVRYCATSEERALVPAHKRLENAPTGCGIPIGNLSSQFFANVYLDPLDQFVKHTLGCRRYLRYVDDFVLVHHERAQLEAWRQQIIAFLAKSLRLSLKAEQHLRPLGDGLDFLGYIVRPTHSVPRRRVIAHARAKLGTWGSRHAHGGFLRVTPAALREVDAIWASYQGHFQHCRAHRLRQDFHRRFPWLQTATGVRWRFHHSAEGKQMRIPINGGQR